MESLEQRQLWSVSLDANGWTVVSPTPGERIIYVSSSSGSDLNSGLSPGSPVKSFNKAESLIQNNQPNQILLKSGDVFYDSFVNWVYSGLDVQDPILVSYYGSGARPLVNSGNSYEGFGTPINQPAKNASVNFLDVMGISFDANTRDPNSPQFTVSSFNPTGFYFNNPGSNILVEDCTFNYYNENFLIEAVEGPITNFTIRRCVDENSYQPNGGRSQGLYALGVTNITIVQSVFDHNGWNTTPVLKATDIGYNHDIYLDPTCTGVTIQSNIIAEASFAGIMARSGGNIDNNLFFGNPVAVSFGSADGSPSAVGGVSGSLIGNTIVGDRALGVLTTTPVAYGQGFAIADIAPGANVVVADNIFTQDTQKAMPAIVLQVPVGTTNASQNVGINNLTIENNILNGFGIGFATDSRFSPGGSGLYALNQLKILNNDFINNTLQQINHGGSISSQETYSGNRYYDTSLNISRWIDIQNSNLPFATWQANYDLGATALSTLPYSNPNVSVAAYDTTVGGPGTWQDFVAQADQLSIFSYRPQFMAGPVVTYVQQGFNVTPTTPVSGLYAPPTAVATTTNLNSLTTGSTYSFTVNYTDAALLLTSSLSSGDLLITGPNGYSQYATYIASATPTIDANGYQHTAVMYQINAPGNVPWNLADNGTYTIDLLPNQVTDSLGNLAPDAVIGSFSVDFTLPTAIATTTNLTSSSLGATSYSFSITYSDAAGIDTTTLNNYQVQVTGPNGYSSYAALSNQTTAANGSIVATYTIAPPNGSWTTDANGSYTVALAASSLFDLAGNPAAGGVLSTFTVNLNGASALSTGTASISGVVFNDANGDGLLDNRENTLNGVTIFIDLAGTGTLAASDPQTTTDVNGNYSLPSLVAGTYTVLEIAPAGFGVTSPSTGSNIVSVTTSAVTAVNFANQPGIGVTSGKAGTTKTTSGTTTTTTGTTKSTTAGTPKSTTAAATPGTSTSIPKPVKSIR